VTRRWLFADQLGPQYLDAPDQPVLLVESLAVFRRRRFHRAKAHLLLTALRHRARELGEQAQYVRADTYDDALAQVDERSTSCSRRRGRPIGSCAGAGCRCTRPAASPRRARSSRRSPRAASAC
jgi:hypothetical protein